jgi:hypothetical protein
MLAKKLPFRRKGPHAYKAKVRHPGVGLIEAFAVVSDSKCRPLDRPASLDPDLWLESFTTPRQVFDGICVVAEMTFS